MRRSRRRIIQQREQQIQRSWSRSTWGIFRLWEEVVLESRAREWGAGDEGWSGSHDQVMEHSLYWPQWGPQIFLSVMGSYWAVLSGRVSSSHSDFERIALSVMQIAKSRRIDSDAILRASNGGKGKRFWVLDICEENAERICEQVKYWVWNKHRC